MKTEERELINRLAGERLIEAKPWSLLMQTTGSRRRIPPAAPATTATRNLQANQGPISMRAPWRSGSCMDQAGAVAAAARESRLLSVPLAAASRRAGSARCPVPLPRRPHEVGTHYSTTSRLWLMCDLGGLGVPLVQWPVSWCVCTQRAVCDGESLQLLCYILSLQYVQCCVYVYMVGTNK